jgi:signal transduction histidine kinase
VQITDMTTSKKHTVNTRLLDLAEDLKKLEKDSLSMTLSKEDWQEKCQYFLSLINQSVEVNQVYQTKIDFNFKLITQLNQSIAELKTNYNNERKKLTESLGSVFLQTKGDGSKAMDFSKSPEAEKTMLALAHLRIAELLKESSELKRVARENIKESQLKTDFLNNLSHELRTPLNAIIGYSQIIKNGTYGPINESIDRDIDAINKSGKHLLRMINQMLEFSKMGSGKIKLKKEHVFIESFIESVVTQLNSLIIDKRLQYKIVVEEKLYSAEFDRDRIFQVVSNMIDNAIKHTAEGFIIIRVETVDIKSVKNIRISVEDTGIGIPEDQIPNLFRAFHQIPENNIKSKAKGTGLGLAISKKIIELHDGHIGIESKKGKGTTIFFTIPLVAVN